MRPLPRLLLLSALSLGLALPGCKRTQGSSETSHEGSSDQGDAESARDRRQRRKAGMPRPLRLPASAPIVVHLERPRQAIAGLQAYSPQVPDARSLLQQLVGTVPGSGPFEAQLSGAVDLERPWDAASVEGQLIVQLPILPARVESVAGLLSDKPPVGRFGAVDLQRSTGPGPKLAYLDRKAATLTLADTERGIATGFRLAQAYGDQPLRLQLKGDEARKYAPQFDLASLELTGQGPHDFEATLEGVPAEITSQLGKLDDGALSGLLETELLAVGGTSKYADYASDVKSILADLKRQVDRQNFLIKGNLEQLRTRLASALRAWNGRTMVGVGPANHLLIGIGSDDPKHLAGAIFHFIDGVRDNLSMARSLGISTPRFRFKRDADKAGTLNVAVFVLENARKYVPSQYHALIDDRGELRVAMAFPSRMGAGMIVVGPASQSTLIQWVADTERATPATESAGHFVAGVSAVDPAKLAPLAQGGDPLSLLKLSPTQAPTRATVVRKDESTFVVRVKGPEVEVRDTRLGRMGRPGEAATPVRRAPRAKATPSQPRSKPARLAPGRGGGKPID